VLLAFRPEQQLQAQLQLVQLLLEWPELRGQRVPPGQRVPEQAQLWLQAVQ
jgi:hypothetical protein